MRNDLPIIKWRTRVRRLHRNGKTPEQIAARLECNVNLVRVQLRIWGLLEERDEG